jgi:hypothetical protein
MNNYEKIKQGNKKYNIIPKIMEKNTKKSKFYIEYGTYVPK